MQISCPAKINLFLKILGKRPDGFHALESLFAFTNLCDKLTINKSLKFQLEVTGEFANLIDLENNLFTQIFQFFCQEFNLDSAVEIKLEKNIPIGGGLGGGSSNAAYFMMALNEIFNLNLDKTALQEISLKFGSDIAFFFENASAIVKGRGEEITAFPKFENFLALLINPKIHLSTKEIFSNFDRNYSKEISNEELLKMDVFTLTKNLANDLEKPAIKFAPQIAKILENCQNFKAKIAKMSGSGSTCFAIFANESDLQEAFQFFNENFPDYFVKIITISHKNPNNFV